jgi:UDP-glucuronate 4-epimerase
MRILITGVAGFIGMSTAKKLLERGEEILGIDNLNDYYDINLKNARLAELEKFSKFNFEKIDVFNQEKLLHVTSAFSPKRILHLAAQAGVRYSVTNPEAYIDSNLKGFLNILQVSRALKVQHLVYASSSSVYGGNTKLPFDEDDAVDHPVSLYAATKKANELMAHTYSHLFGIPTTGLRFFTVYGPWGRPDMSPFLFTNAILKGEIIEVFNEGRMQRDFTYIDDIVEGIIRVIDKPATSDKNYNPFLPNSASRIESVDSSATAGLSSRGANSGKPPSSCSLNPSTRNGPVQFNSKRCLCFQEIDKFFSSKFGSDNLRTKLLKSP